jgi:beta-lactamase class A
MIRFSRPHWRTAYGMRSELLLIGLYAAAVCAGPSTAADASGRAASLQRQLIRLADEARPGTLGLAVSDLQSGRTWRVNSAQAFPMMSVFKAPLGATVLSEVDARTLSLGQRVIVKRDELVRSGLSRITATFQGRQETFTVRQLLDAAVSASDNTAADVLLKLIGGPGVATAFLRQHGIRHMRIDRGEGEIAREFQGRAGLKVVGSDETAQEKDARLLRGYAAYLKDPRDRSTPEAAASFLKKLWQGQLLTPASTRLLLHLLYRQTMPDRLRAGIPPAVRFADKCGTSYTLDGETAAFNDIGILTWPDGHTVIVAAFLMGSRASEARRRALFERIAQAVVSDLDPQS